MAYKIKIQAHDPDDADIAQYDSILDALDAEGVFELHPMKGLIRVQENCDNYFRVFLTKEQLHKLADEIKEIADSL